MKYFQKSHHSCFLDIVLWLLFCNKGGVAQLCNPLRQDDTNTAKFCLPSSTSGHTIFLISGTPKYEAIHSCSCDINISRKVGDISLSYSAGNANDNCGVNIDIDDVSDVFTCTSDDLVVHTLRTIEFSRSTTVETNFCLEISLGSQNNSTISVTCTTDRRDNIVTTARVTRKNDGGNGLSAALETWTVNGFTNSTETTSDVSDKQTKDEGKKSNSTTVIIAGAGAVWACAILIVAVIVYCYCRRRKLKAHTSADHEYVNTTQNTVATENIEINSAFPTVHNDANIRMKDVEVAYDTVADATYNTVDDTTDEMKSAKLSSIKYENIADDGGKYKTIDAVADKARKADNIRNMTSDVLVDTAYETLERTEDKTSDYTDLRY